jgi:hypothetical protein
MTPVEKLRDRLAQTNKERAELKIEGERLSKMDALMISADVISSYWQKVSRASAYCAALEFALETLGENPYPPEKG